MKNKNIKEEEDKIRKEGKEVILLWILLVIGSFLSWFFARWIAGVFTL